MVRATLPKAADWLHKAIVEMLSDFGPKQSCWGIEALLFQRMIKQLSQVVSCFSPTAFFTWRFHKVEIPFSALFSPLNQTPSKSLSPYFLLRIKYCKYALFSRLSVSPISPNKCTHNQNPSLNMSFLNYFFNLRLPVLNNKVIAPGRLLMIPRESILHLW